MVHRLPSAAVLLLAACLLGGCVHEELKPVRETTLTVARAAGEVTLHHGMLAAVSASVTA